MGEIDLTEVRAYRIKGKGIVWDDCIGDTETDDLEEYDYIMDEDLEDPEKRYFCDRCHKAL